MSIKISDLTPLVTAVSDDIIPIVDMSVPETKHIQVSDLKISLNLNNVDNTTDANKPVSTATQAALDLKVNLSAIGDLAALDDVNTAQLVNQSVTNAKLENMNANTFKGRLAGNGTPQDLNLSDIPVSTAVQSALDLKYNASNPSAFETPAQLDTRDTNNRARSNHSGTQSVSTITGLATVATSGAYADLTGSPTIPDISNFETTTQLNTRDTANRQRANHTGTQSVSTIDGGGNNGFASYSGSGVLQTVAGTVVGSYSGGINQQLTKSVVDSASGDSNLLRINVNASINAPDSFVNNLQLFNAVDTASAGFDLGTGGRATTCLNAFIEHIGESDTGSLDLIQTGYNVGNGTDAIDVGGIGYVYGFGQVNANVSMLGAIQGYGFQPTVHEDAVLTSSAFLLGFYDGADINCPLGSGYTSFNASPGIDTVPNGTNYTGVNINPNIPNFTGNGGAVGLNITGNYGTFETDGYLNCISIRPTVTEGQYVSGINISMDNVTVYAGVQASLVEQDLTYTFVQPGSNNNNIQLEYIGGGTAGSEVVTLVGDLITIEIEDGVSTASQIFAAFTSIIAIAGNITATITGTGSNPQDVFGPVNFAGGINAGNKQAAYLDGNVEITGSLSFGGALSIGTLSAFGSATLIDSGFTPASIHSLISSPTIGNNETVINADIIGVNTASLITIGTNSTITTNLVGISALGLPAVVRIGAGSTVDRIAGATFALSLEVGAAGTVNEIGLCRSVGIPNGTTTVNRLYGYEFSLPFGDPGTDTWGLYSIPNCNNYMGGSLRIGGTAVSDDKVTNTSLAFEVVGDKAMRLPVLTTTQRNALTALEGMIIFNTTSSVMEVYDGAAWI